MTSNKEVEKIIRATFDEVLRLRKVKGGEYSEEGDALANFRRNGADLGLPMEVVWSVLAFKHWNAVTNHVRDISKGTTRELSEPIEGRIDDLVVYLCLLKAMLRERQSCQTESSDASSAPTSRPLIGLA